MPLHETKKVTVAFTTVVSGSGRPDEFIATVTERLRAGLDEKWSSPDGMRTAQAVVVTEVHLETP